MASNFSFPFKQRPTDDKKPNTVGEFISRMNIERGGFRNITEDGLRKEIEEQQNGVVEDPDAATASEDEDEEAQPTTVEDIRSAREEVLRAIE